MKMYKVNVNGTEYEITLEVVDAADVKPAAPAPAAAPAPVAEAAPAPATAPAAAGGETVVAPMPGTILSVNVANGAAVKKGDVLLVLEAMKMENEIMAPCDGTVSSVPATKGATVNTGDVLCVIA
ncbi:MAG: biotin/lipoyl-binding protein [Clostridia bacterium]|nr:biotin/lipoyl-binding protein [Clostridia bacterium]MBQ5798211.1 biotin/lipoyl-binding protein [Clostridia bacterium]MBQ5900751.1 biotin/lipoyl-binding protein [Clostridia bacterium]